MRRAVGLSVGAVVLSITLGMLIGFVVHTGMQQRAEHPPRPTGAAVVPPDTTGGTSPSVAIPAWVASITPASQVAPVTPITATTESVASVPAAVAVTETGAGSTPPSPTPPTSPSRITTPSSPTAAPPPSAAHSPRASAGGPCDRLGAESATAAGATVFCQHDQKDRSLRWRAVTDGGGCLNRTMTGVGADGHRYACRRGPHGLNHWRRVG